MENCCRKILFCDAEPVWRIVAGRYCFVMRCQCGELLQADIVCDSLPVRRTVAESIVL